MVANVLAQVKTKMSNGIRRAGFFAVIGTLVAVLIIASVAISGVTIPSLRLPMFTPNTGTLIVKLTDKPVNVTHLNVTISGVSVHREEHGWENLTFVDEVSEVYVDLLKLENVTMDLCVTEVPPGNYTMIKMYITTANVTYVDGGTDDLNVPSDAIRVIIHFEVKAGEETNVLIDIIPDWIAISQSKNLRPVLKATLLE